VTGVQQRGAEVLAARKLSSALSAAQAIANHLKDWVQGTAPGEFVSMGVLTTSDNPYDVPADIFFSFPVTCQGGKWAIVPGLTLSPETRRRLPATVEELVEERALALSLLSTGGAAHL
jgi:malate dehydrogenase